MLVSIFLFFVLNLFFVNLSWAKNCDVYGEEIDYSYFDRSVDLNNFRILFNSNDGEEDLWKYEDIANQIRSAEIIYDEMFNVKGINYGDRYDNVKQVFVFIKPMNKYNGLVLSRSVGGVFEEGGCVLRMNINKNISNRNLTPAHELFHLYHFSITSINRPWLREGLARWAMHTFSGELYSEDVLPENMEQMKNVFKKSYAASSFWTRLVLLLDRSSDLHINHLNEFPEYVDGSTIVRGDTVVGGRFVKDLFFELSERNMELSKTFGVEWFRNKNNNDIQDEVIFESIKKVAAKYNSGSKELEDFLSIDKL